MNAALKRDWLSVDLDGMAQVLRRRGDFAWLLYELIQNCWDTQATRVDVHVRPIPGRPLVEVTVADDDPDGFRDLAHAYTLYAPSEKKADATKRGRYNVGEKLVLAFCDEASIHTTTGKVIFDGHGRKHTMRGSKRASGSVFRGLLRLTRAEMETMNEGVKLLLPPIPTFLNDEPIQTRKPVHRFETTLATELADGEGALRRTSRHTTVRIYDPRPGETGRIYEMGIPVVETGDPWIVEVLQKVPLNVDRDNVTPAFLRELRVAVVNEVHGWLRPEETSSAAVRDALSDHRIEDDAVRSIVTKQFGDKRATTDPSDREANGRATANGYAVIHPRAFTLDQWEQVRRAEAAKPAGQLFPTPKPYSDDPNAPVAQLVPESEWTAGMCNIAAYAEALARRILLTDVKVRFERRRGACDRANYCHGQLCFNLGNMTQAWFDAGPNEEVDGLLLHEFAHEFEANHLSDRFHEATCRLGAKLKTLAMREPGFFLKYGWKPAT